jgi:DNA-directed RNA polymerase specialized sigma24 family protein
MDLTDEHIKRLLKACRLNKREAQKELYRHYFGYAMNVASKYSRDYNMAVEIVNDTFLKIYCDLKNRVLRIDNTVDSFKVWLRNTVFDTCMEQGSKCSAKEIVVSVDTGQVLPSYKYKTA